MHNSIKQNGWWLSKLEGEDLNGLLDIAKELGVPVGGRKKGQLIEILKPQDSESANKKSLSKRFGFSAFPYHCDTAHWATPIRYIVLGCINPGSCGRKTFLIDWQKIEFELREINLLRNAVFLIKNGRNSFYSTILDQNEKFFRFDPGCMSPVDNEASNTLNLIEDKISEVEPIEISWKKGSVLVIDNWRMLHGRGCVSVMSENLITRELHRVLVA